MLLDVAVDVVGCVNVEVLSFAVWMYVCMDVCVYACMYICMYVRMYACMHECIYTCMYVMYVMYVCVCMYVCMYVCTYVRMYVCMHVCMYVCFIVIIVMFEQSKVDARPFQPTIVAHLPCASQEQPSLTQRATSQNKKQQ